MPRNSKKIGRNYRWPKIGEKYNMLTVISEPFRDGQPERVFVLCKCDCGNERKRLISEVVSGRIMSCGCLKNVNEHSKKHGLEGTRIYRVYRGMINRCYDKSAINYERYGGIGIRVCQKWKNDIHSFVRFAYDHGYDDEKVMDRIDSKKGYCPENVRFTTIQENNNNRKNVRKYKAFGKIKTIRDWSNDNNCKVDYSTLHSRLDQGWDIRKALTTPQIKRFAKVDESIARSIKKDLQLGFSGKCIAQKYKVSPQCVCGIKKGRSWAHITV